MKGVGNDRDKPQQASHLGIISWQVS